MNSSWTTTTNRWSTSTHTTWSAPKRLINDSILRSVAVRSCGGVGTKLVINSKLMMRDRSNNRKPLQKGRNLSAEAIQAVQALKRAPKSATATSGTGSIDLEPTLETSFRRLLKLDMMAVLRELLRQNQCYLALKVFEEIQKEYWYRPQISLYAELVSHLGSNGLIKEIEFLFLRLKKERHLEPDIEGFNALLESLVNFNLTSLVIECLYLMKSIGCDLDKLSFKILIDGLESIGEVSLSAMLRLEAQKHYGQSLYFQATRGEDKMSSN